jgi:putative ABC transport system permease protein
MSIFTAVNSFDIYRGYIKIAVRSLLRNKLVSGLNISGLSIGMAVCLILALWVLDELSFNHGYVDHERIARVIQNVTKNGEVVTWRTVPVPLSGELQKNYGSDFESIAQITAPQWELLSVGNEVLIKQGRYVEPDFFKLFSLKLVSGQESQLTGTSSIFLSESVAKAYFGDFDALGKTMTLTSPNSGSIEVSVAGVYEDFPTQSEFSGTDYIVPWDIQLTKPQMKDMDEPWKYNFVELYVKLKPFASFASASAKIKDARLLRVSNEVAKMKPELFLFPMDDWHLFAEFKNGKNAGGRIQYVWLFGAVGVFVLLMASINFMNLTTARSERRAKEVGVRKSIGSVRRQLIVLFLTESGLITLLSFCTALTLTIIALPAFNMLVDKHIIMPWHEPNFWILSLVSCCLITLICGIYPAIYLSSIGAIHALKGTYRSRKSSSTLRRGLVVVQFTISVVLMVVTITVSQQIQFAMSRPLGYDRNALITVPVISDIIHRHFDAFSERLGKSGAIVSVTEAWGPPTVKSWLTTSIYWQGKDPGVISGFAVFDVADKYGKTIGWEMKLGRDFRQNNLSDTANIIINEAAMKYMGFKDPIGQDIEWFEDRYKIIGVVNNVIYESPYRPVQPAVYRMMTGAGHSLIIRANLNSELSAVIGQIEATFKEFNPGEPFSYQFVDEEYTKKFLNEEYVKKLTQVFSVMAIFIGCLGLFGFMSYNAEQRTKEIGIRKVLGASVTNIWMMLSKDFVLLVMFSGVIAVPLGYYVINAWLENYDYRITITWFIFVKSIFSVLIVALLTVSYQTIAAAYRNPVRSLRSE